MYPDQKRIRSGRVVIRLNGYEEELLKQLSIKTGDQLSTMLREIVIHKAREILGHDPNAPLSIEYMNRIT